MLTPSASVSPISSPSSLPFRAEPGEAFRRTASRQAAGRRSSRVDPTTSCAAAMVAVGRAGEQDGTGRVQGLLRPQPPVAPPNCAAWNRFGLPGRVERRHGVDDRGQIVARAGRSPRPVEHRVGASPRNSIHAVFIRGSPSASAVQEAGQRRLQTLLKPLVREPPRIAERQVSLGEREHVRVDPGAEMLERARATPTPAIPADHRRRRRQQQAVPLVERLRTKAETQSIAFLSTPGTEALYSGEEITNASVASSRRRNSSAPAGKQFAPSASPSYEPMSNSRIDTKSAAARRLDALDRHSSQTGVERLVAEQCRHDEYATRLDCVAFHHPR